MRQVVLLLQVSIAGQQHLFRDQLNLVARANIRLNRPLLKASNHGDQWFSTFLGGAPAKFPNKFCGPVNLKNQPKRHDKTKC